MILKDEITKVYAMEWVNTLNSRKDRKIWQSAAPLEIERKTVLPLALLLLNKNSRGMRVTTGPRSFLAFLVTMPLSSSSKAQSNSRLPMSKGFRSST
jgi:hypothetical protein